MTISPGVGCVEMWKNTRPCVRRKETGLKGTMVAIGRLVVCVVNAHHASGGWESEVGGTGCGVLLCSLAH